MNATFARLMAEATRLTRGGDLQAATAAIQAAIGRNAAPTTPSAVEMIDVIEDRDVIDIQAFEVIDADATATQPSPTAEDCRAGQFIVGSHTDTAGTRAYKLYIPPAYSGQALPLVVMLHGCTQDPDDFAIGTRMNEAAREQGVFVLYPAQTQHANASRCWNWFKHNHQGRGRGEPALLAGMTIAVIERYGMDRGRVYVAGLSAGGAMAAIVGEAYPELFAAVGVHSGLAVGAASNMASAFAAMQGGAAASLSARSPVRRPPTIVFHGDKDGTVHPINGERVASTCASGVAPQTDRFADENGRACTRHTYRDSEGRVVSEHWVVHDAGHAWSGGSSRGSFADTAGPNATSEMLRFFAAQGRTAGR